MKEPSFKFIVALFGLPLLIAAADWAWTQGPVSKYKSNGVSAYYEVQDTFGEEYVGSGIIVRGSRRATVSIDEAEALNTVGISGTYFQLNFEISVSSDTGFGYAYGSGQIPAKCVTFEKPVNHNLILKVNTNDLPSPPFYSYSYGTIPVNLPIIGLRWDRTDNDWNRWEGHQITDIGTSLVAHFQGSGVRYFTIPSGSITLPDVGFPLIGSYQNGWLGSQKSATTILERVPKK